ncbi:MFS transporter [Enterococcus sp. LJL98]
MTKNKNILLLTGSQLFSVLGTTLMQFAISLYVLDLTKSLWTFSFITALAIIGRVLCLPICGILADRLPKKKMMLVMDTGYLIFALLYYLVTSLEHGILFIGILTVLLGMISAFETPVVQSAIPLLCTPEQIPQTNSIISGIGILGGIFGPIFAGMVYQFERMHLIFIWSGVLFFLAILCEVVLQIPLVQRAVTDASIFKIVQEDFMEILAFLRKKVVILQICIVALLLNLFLSAFIQVMIPYLSRIQLQVTDGQFGLMNTCFAIGGLLGTVFYGIKGKTVTNQWISNGLFLVSFIFLGLLLPLHWMNQLLASFWTMLVIVSFIMALFSFVSLQLIVYIQMNVPTDFLGRVMAFVMVLSAAAMPLGQLFYGGIGNLLAGDATMWLIVGVSFVSLMIALYSRKVVAKM